MEKLIEIQVTPSVIHERAEILTKAIAKGQRAVSRAFGIIKSTESCFCGKAGDTFRISMQENMKNWERSLKNMEEGIFELLEIAKEYQKAEGENTDAIHGIII